MAVNTLKFLPPSKSGALAVRTSKISIGKKDEEKGGSLVKSEGGSLANEILKMKTKILKLQGEFDKNKKSQQKEEENKRKTEEKEKRSKREKQFEKRDGKGVNLPNVISRLPGGNIVDTIKRFLGFTFLGWLVGKYEVLMPQLEKFMSFAKPVFEGLVFATESIIKGVYGFVETGYKAYDKVSATIKQIGGEDAEKTFNEFSSHLNKLLNGTLMAAMLIASTSSGGKPGKMPGGKPGGSPGGTKPNQRLQSYLNRNSQTKLIEQRYGNEAARMYEARRSQGASAQRALADVKGKFQPLDSQGSLGGANQGSGIFKRGLSKAPQRAATKMFGKAAGKTVSKLGGRIPIVGPLIDFGIRTLIYKEPLGKAAAGAVGMGVGQAIGGWLGGAIGGIVGSVVPFVGTMLVGAVGATIGSLIGGVIGDMIGAGLYDFVSGSSGDKNKKPTKRAMGGSVPPARQRTKRKVQSLPQRKKIIPQNTNPGKDIGGRYKIEKFYGSEKINENNPQDKRTRGQVIVNSLEKSSKEVKKLPLDWVASIGGAFIDMTMGQKPDKRVASDVAKSFGNFVDTVVNNEISATTGQITKALIGMANGGSVPQHQIEKGQVAKKVTQNIEQRLQNIFEQSSSIVMKNLREVGYKDGTKSEEESNRRGSGGGGGGGGDEAADYTDIVKIDMGGFSQEDIDALGRMVAAEAGNQSDLGKAGVLSVILNRYRLAKAGDAGYMPDGKNKNNVTIKDILYDTGQFTPIRDGRFDRTSSAAGKNALSDAIAASGNDPQKFKKLLMEKQKLSETDAETVVRATAFSNPKTRGSKPFDTPEVALGSHSFQESPYSKIGSFPGAISAKVQKLDLSMGGLEKGAQVSRRDASTRKYGQISITGGNPYSDLDGQETGVNIELFGSRGKINKKFANNSAEGPYGNRGVEISLPYEMIYYDKIPGGINAGKPSIDIHNTTNRVVKGQGTGGFGHVGSYFYRDPKDGKLYEIMFAHGDKPFKKFKNGEKIPPGTVIGYQGASGSSSDGSGGLYDHISFHVNAVDGGNRADSIIRQFTNSLLNGEGAKITSKARASAERKTRIKGDTRIYEALSKKKSIGFSMDGQKYFFNMKPDGTYEVYRSKNIFGYQEPIDISDQKNRRIKKAVQDKIATMYVSEAMSNRETSPTTLDAVQKLLSITDIPKGVSINQSTLLKEFSDNRKVIGINLGAGHQGPGGAGTTDPVSGVKEHEAVLHMLTAIKKIIQEKDSDLAKKTTFTSFQNDNYAKDNAKYFTKLQKQMIELHFDQYGGGGRSGVIASRGRRYGVTASEGGTSALDIALMKRFGNYGKDFKLDNLGISDTGGTILELGAIDSMPALMKEIKAGKFGPETMKLARYTYLGIREGAEKEGLVKPISPEKLAEVLGVPKKEKKETKSPQVQDLSKVKPTKTTKVMQGQSEVTLYGPDDPRRNAQKDRAWWDPRRLVGMQGGGSTAQMASQPQTSYSSLNKSGTLKYDTSMDKQVIVMTQKEIIMVPS